MARSDLHVGDPIPPGGHLDRYGGPQTARRRCRRDNRLHALQGRQPHLHPRPVASRRRSAQTERQTFLRRLQLRDAGATRRTVCLSQPLVVGFDDIRHQRLRRHVHAPMGFRHLRRGHTLLLVYARESGKPAGSAKQFRGLLCPVSVLAEYFSAGLRQVSAAPARVGPAAEGAGRDHVGNHYPPNRLLVGQASSSVSRVDATDATATGSSRSTRTRRGHSRR